MQYLRGTIYQESRLHQQYLILGLVDVMALGVPAATNNDSYNLLVCTAMAAEVGRSHAFQLPMGEQGEDYPRGVARGSRGRMAFDEQAVFEKLWRRQVRAWIFYKTRITENDSY